MVEITLEERVLRLEQQASQFATRDDVRALGAEISQLGDEMRLGFSALRDELREEIRRTDAETLRVLDDRIATGDEETRRVLRDEIRAGDEETRRQARLLHEDLVERISTLQR